MADVAAALGVAKGTLYLYVESKEALFDLVARYAEQRGRSRRSPPLPVRHAESRERRSVRARASWPQRQVPPALATALAQQRTADVRAEIEAIIRELYDTLARTAGASSCSTARRATTPSWRPSGSRAAGAGSSRSSRSTSKIAIAPRSSYGPSRTPPSPPGSSWRRSSSGPCIAIATRIRRASRSRSRRRPSCSFVVRALIKE